MSRLSSLTPLIPYAKGTWLSHVHALLALLSYSGNLRNPKSALNDLAASPQALLALPSPRPSASGLVIGCLSCSWNQTSLCPSLSHLVFHPFVPEPPLVCPLCPILIDFYVLNPYFAWFQTPVSSYLVPLPFDSVSSHPFSWSSSDNLQMRGQGAGSAGPGIKWGS